MYEFCMAAHSKRCEQNVRAVTREERVVESIDDFFPMHKAKQQWTVQSVAYTWSHM